MEKIRDTTSLINQKFNQLTVLSFSHVDKHRTGVWKCQCDCGNLVLATKGGLKYNLKRSCKSCKNAKHLVVDYTGMMIGKTLVVERAPNKIRKNGSFSVMWKCKCECGEIIFRTSGNIKRNFIKCSKCKIQKDNSRFLHEEIKYTTWKIIKGNAVRRNIEFNITIEYIWELFLKQDRKCALSGLDIELAKVYADYKNKKVTGSLDRKNNKLGYVEGNVQWVHKNINRMKNIFDENYFIEICHHISDYQKACKDV